MSKFKKGDRVRVAAFEGTVCHAPTYGLEISVGESSVFIPHNADVTVEKVVSANDWRNGDWVKSPDGQRYIRLPDNGWARITYPLDDDTVAILVKYHGWKVGDQAAEDERGRER